MHLFRKVKKKSKINKISKPFQVSQETKDGLDFYFDFGNNILDFSAWVLHQQFFLRNRGGNERWQHF